MNRISILAVIVLVAVFVSICEGAIQCSPFGESKTGKTRLKGTWEDNSTLPGQGGHGPGHAGHQGHDTRTAMNPMTYWGGPTLSGTVYVYLIYYGPGFSCGTKAFVENYFRDYYNSPYEKILRQYSSVVGGVQTLYSGVTFGASRSINATVYGTTISDLTLQRMVQDSITGGYFPEKKSALYFIYGGTGIAIGSAGSWSCTNWCGYHYVFNSTTKTPISYGVGSIDTACIAGPTGCGWTTNVTNVMTTVGGHELAETITDTQEGFGNDAWMQENSDSSWGEVSDGCMLYPVNVTLQTKGYSYMMEYLYSNANSNCATSNATALIPSVPISPISTAISVTWVAPSGANDWIGFYACGAPNSPSPPDWTWTYGATSGNWTVTSSYTATAGCYEWRYFVGSGYTLLSASSQQVQIVNSTTLQAPHTSIGSDRVYSNTTTVTNLIINWAAIGTPSTTDWIGIWPLGSLPGGPASNWWIYTNGAKTGQAIIPYSSIPSAGGYKVYYLPNNGYVATTNITITAQC